MSIFHYNRKNFNLEDKVMTSLEDIMSSISGYFDSFHQYSLVCDPYEVRFMAGAGAGTYVVICRSEPKNGGSVEETLVGCCGEELTW